MELRLDRLLESLRLRPEGLLEAIDRDPLLLKKESSGLVLANASQELYTPQAAHQLFAKGIVYRRQPYRLVSLPLIKIYNLGEKSVTLDDLARMAAEPEVRLHFLRKVDGSLIQVFRADGRVWFTTRGLLEGRNGTPRRAGGTPQRAFPAGHGRPTRRTAASTTSAPAPIGRHHLPGPAERACPAGRGARWSSS